MDADVDISTFHPHRPGIRKVLGDLEAEIMEFIWARSSSDQGIMVRTIFEALYERRRIAYTTVMSTMERLARKNILRVEKHEQAYIYYPNATRQQFISYFVGCIVEDLLESFSGEVLETMHSLQHSLVTQRACQLYTAIESRCQEEETV
jgi:predicted transcriptional regulator